MSLISRKRLGDLAVLGTASVLAALVLELCVRVYLFGGLRGPQLVHDKLLSTPHPKLGWTFKPNETALSQTLDFIVTSQTNSRGLNDDDTPYDKPEGVFRIVVLGDSFMFAREVERWQALPALLEEQLRDREVEVVNLGVVGYGTLQEYLYLQEEGFKYGPDLVLLGAYFMNDVRDNSLPLNERMWGRDAFVSWGRPYAAWNDTTHALDFSFPDWKRLQEGNETRAGRLEKEYDQQARWWSRTATGMLLSHVVAGALKGMQAPEYDPLLMFGPYAESGVPPELATLWEDAWQVTAQAIAAAAASCRDHEVSFAVFTIPDRYQVNTEYRARVAKFVNSLTLDLERPEKRIEAIGKQESFPVLNLTPYFRELTDKSGPPLHFLLEDHHWTPEGHARATERLVTFLDDSKLLPAP